MLRKLAALLALWLVLLALALSTGWNAVWLLVYSLGLLVAGSALWANWNVAGLELRRRHRARRIQVGDRISLTFENRQTVLFQIHEMIRVEQIRSPEKIEGSAAPSRARAASTLLLRV